MVPDPLVDAPCRSHVSSDAEAIGALSPALIATQAPAMPAPLPTQALADAKFVHLFSVPLMYQVWSDAAALNVQLRARILARAALDAGDRRTNVGGWHSASGQLEFLGDLRAPLIERMHLMANEATQRLATECGIAPLAVQWSFYAWANVCRTGDFHTTHTHPGATWSGVYYVDTGDSPGERDTAALRFLDPAPGSANAFFPYLLRTCPEIQPVAGLMVLFPSYLPHMVHPHKGGGPRISIAFNFRKEPYP